MKVIRSPTPVDEGKKGKKKRKRKNQEEEQDEDDLAIRSKEWNLAIEEAHHWVGTLFNSSRFCFVRADDSPPSLSVSPRLTQRNSTSSATASKLLLLSIVPLLFTIDDSVNSQLERLPLRLLQTEPTRSSFRSSHESLPRNRS